MLPDNSTAYIGAVGKDALADQLRAANDREGLYSAYQVVEDAPTGACAVVLSGHNRSLCTELGAAEKFDKSHLEKQEIKELIEGAKFFYLGGFFLTHGVESALILAKHSHENKKVGGSDGSLLARMELRLTHVFFDLWQTFAMNLSAPFIPQFFKSQLNQVLEYADIVIGNESEAAAFAESHSLKVSFVLK